MTTIKSADELKKLAEKAKAEMKGNEGKIQIRVAMATCSIAAGSKATLSAINEGIKEEGIKDTVVIQTGCMGYCYGEPTVEVTMPGKKPVVFSDVDAAKAKKIIFSYVKGGHDVDGSINNDYDKID